MSPVPFTLPPDAPRELPHPVGADPETGTPAGWQKELAHAIRTLPDLLSYLKIPAEFLISAGRLPVDAGFPLLVPRSFADRMRTGDPQDPLLRQVLPVSAEQESPPGYVSDPVHDAAATRQAGLLQKYHGRALLVTNGLCAVHCRYCFRRQFPYQDLPGALSDWRAVIEDLTADATVTEIILSGGDPLTWSDQRLATLCRLLDEIPHVERIRIHSRLPIVLPSRVTPELLAMLGGLRAQPWFVVHSNHAHELTGDCAAQLRRMVRSGIPVLNQAVLLRGINDSVDAMEALCRRLIALGVTPYYLHQLDRIRGAAHFEVPDETGRAIVAALVQKLPGYAIPRFVREVPGQPAKTSLV